MSGSCSWMSYGAQGVKGFDDDSDDDDNDDFGLFFRRPNIANSKQTKLYIRIFSQCHHMLFVYFVVLPPGHGRSVTDF